MAARTAGIDRNEDVTSQPPYVLHRATAKPSSAEPLSPMHHVTTVAIVVDIVMNIRAGHILPGSRWHASSCSSRLLLSEMKLARQPQIS